MKDAIFFCEVATGKLPLTLANKPHQCPWKWPQLNSMGHAPKGRKDETRRRTHWEEYLSGKDSGVMREASDRNSLYTCMKPSSNKEHIKILFTKEFQGRWMSPDLFAGKEPTFDVFFLFFFKATCYTVTKINANKARFEWVNYQTKMSCVSMQKSNRKQ